MTLIEQIDHLTSLQADRRRLSEELKALNDRIAKDGPSPGLKQRGDNLLAGIGRLDEQINTAQAEANAAAVAGLKDGSLSTESGDGAAPATSPVWSRGPSPSARDTGWGAAMLKAASHDGRFKALVPSGSVVVPNLTAGIVRTADRPRSLLQLVPLAPRLVETDQYSFLRETVRTHAAAPVATGALKPTSVYSVARLDATVKTIAHLSERIPRQTLADARLLQAYVEGSLREGVELALEDQVVNGPGTGENLLGIDDTPSIQQQAWSTNILITTRKAVTKLEAVQIPGGAFVLTPADWESVELFADSTGDFIMGDQVPVNRAARTLWGQPVVTSTTVDAGKGFLVDFAGSTMLWEREGVRVDWSENTYDSVAAATDFERNLVRFRAEGRWGFAVTRPAGVVEIDTAA